MKKKHVNKLSLFKETVTNLETQEMKGVKVAGPCQMSSCASFALCPSIDLCK